MVLFSKVRSFICLVWVCITPMASAGSFAPVDVGAAQTDLYFPLLENKRIGVVVNQTSRVNDQHLVDLLLEAEFNVQTIFAPEHGFRGDHSAGEIVSSNIDPTSGVKITSIYGKRKKPKANIMAELDVIIFDIQDVGVRFYTYISSMHYMMQAAAEHDVEFIVLDRPNPNIQFVQGPILEPEFRSFVGLHPIPVLHGMTVGELAKMILAEGWLSINSTLPKHNYQLDLTVIPVANYTRAHEYPLPIAPSPNLPNQQAVTLYPSLCLFEATPISVGRGTTLPFQVLGHNKVHIGDYSFTPKSIKGVSEYPKLQGIELTGQNLTESKIKGFDLSLFFSWFEQFNQFNQKIAKQTPRQASKAKLNKNLLNPNTLADNPQGQVDFFQRPEFMDKLAGTDKLRKAMLSGLTLAEVEQTWQDSLIKFKQQRRRYLIYP